MRLAGAETDHEDVVRTHEGTKRATSVLSTAAEGYQWEGKCGHLQVVCIRSVIRTVIHEFDAYAKDLPADKSTAKSSKRIFDGSGIVDCPINSIFDRLWT